jgi:hypothetical protein
MRLIKIIVPILVLGLLLGMALPVLAAPNRERGGQPIGKVGVVRGEVQSITGNVITIGDKDVQVNDQTRYHIPTRGKLATLADIEVGMQVVAMVYNQDGTLIARQVLVIPGRPEIKHHVGTVTDFSYDPATGGSITIEDKDGNSLAFVILAGQFKVLPQGATVAVGDKVTVISHRDPAQDRLIASGVVIRQPRPEAPQEISGIITVDTIDETLTIGTTVIKYNDQTIFILRGVLEVQSGQQATIVYREVDSELVATRVMIGVDLPQIQTQIQAQIGRAEEY